MNRRELFVQKHPNLDLRPLHAIRTLSHAARVVVDAAAWLDRTVYTPESGSWHHPVLENDDIPGLCIVCDGGAVLAHLGATVSENCSPMDVSSAIEDRLNYRIVGVLHAIDHMRSGLYVSAIRQMSISLTSEQEVELFALRRPVYSAYTCEAEDPWGDFDDHIADLRDRVIPALEALGL